MKFLLRVSLFLALVSSVFCGSRDLVRVSGISGEYQDIRLPKTGDEVPELLKEIHLSLKTFIVCLTSDSLPKATQASNFLIGLKKPKGFTDWESSGLGGMTLFNLCFIRKRTS